MLGDLTFTPVDTSTGAITTSVVLKKLSEDPDGTRFESVADPYFTALVKQTASGVKPKRTLIQFRHQQIATESVPASDVTVNLTITQSGARRTPLQTAHLVANCLATLAGGSPVDGGNENFPGAVEAVLVPLIRGER